jgi:hypothetical protein
MNIIEPPPPQYLHDDTNSTVIVVVFLLLKIMDLKISILWRVCMDLFFIIIVHTSYFIESKYRILYSQSVHINQVTRIYIMMPSCFFFMQYRNAICIKPNILSYRISHIQ